VLPGVVALGCSYEGANPAYMSINVLPQINLALVRDYLIRKNAEWEHADPTYEEMFPDEA